VFLSVFVTPILYFYRNYTVDKEQILWFFQCNKKKSSQFLTFSNSEEFDELFYLLKLLNFDIVKISNDFTDFDINKPTLTFLDNVFDLENLFQVPLHDIIIYFREDYEKNYVSW